MRYARNYDAQITPGGGLSVEIFKGDAPPPNSAPGGPRTEWQSAADLAVTLAESEAIVAEHLAIIAIAKHFQANGNIVNPALLTKINTDPAPVKSLDMTGASAVISV